MSALVEIEDLTVAYGDRIAVDALRFSVAEGTFVGFLGPNGAGKSSLIGAIISKLISFIGTRNAASGKDAE